MLRFVTFLDSIVMVSVGQYQEVLRQIRVGKGVQIKKIKSQDKLVIAFISSEGIQRLSNDS